MGGWWVGWKMRYLKANKEPGGATVPWVAKSQTLPSDGHTHTKQINSIIV